MRRLFLVGGRISLLDVSCSSRSVLGCAYGDVVADEAGR